MNGDWMRNVCKLFGGLGKTARVGETPHVVRSAPSEVRTRSGRDPDRDESLQWSSKGPLYRVDALAAPMAAELPGQLHLIRRRRRHLFDETNN